jgi:hypothetical protein
MAESPFVSWLKVFQYSLLETSSLNFMAIGLPLLTDSEIGMLLRIHLNCSRKLIPAIDTIAASYSGYQMIF